MTEHRKLLPGKSLACNLHFLVKENVAIIKAKELHKLVDLQLSRFACTNETAETSSQEQAAGGLLPQSHRLTVSIAHCSCFHNLTIAIALRGKSFMLCTLLRTMY